MRTIIKSYYELKRRNFEDIINLRSWNLQTGIWENSKRTKETVSEVYREIYGLEYAEFNLSFSVKEKTLLSYVQTLSVLTYGFTDWLRQQVVFYTEKGNKKKQEFYEFIYKNTNSLYSYFNDILLPMCDEGFETLTDNAAEIEAENIEAVAYLIEKGNAEDWNKVRKLAKPYIRKIKVWQIIR